MTGEGWIPGGGTLTLEISVASIAHTAGVDRTFLYRHRDLLAKIHAIQAQPGPDPATGPNVSRASLNTDLLSVPV